MLKQFVVVIPNILTIVNKMSDFATVKKEELKSHVETDHRDGIINVMSVISQQ